jgi:hypothetical protein
VAQERTKADERWASRGLVAMLIREMKDYKAAAEVVSGSDDVFAMCSRQIGDSIARIQEIPTAVSALELQQVLNNARAEIAEHQKWQTEVIGSLPPRDDEEGLTGPLRQAFTKTGTTRAKLLTEVMQAEDKWLKAQAEAFKLDE